ncbi:MAG: peptidase T [Treponema sp.]|uniref:peptidase T n=1 Tax=Treponema sp. TaxID=166 RepID=UPI00298E00C2|nr:peptidase T [Treponema sp.]MBR5933674.1 peptidase T [Treponema sp.]
MKYLSLNSDEAKKIQDRFTGYAKIHSTSSSENADKGIIPSTPEQFDFARKLQSELETLNFENVQLTENCYLYASIPAAKGYEKAKAFCLLAHMDTVEEVSGLNVNPQVFKDYDGKVIDLKGGIKLDPAKNSALRQAAEENDTIITTDGTTLLGGDDKAGITIIVSALEYLMSHPEIPHGKIEVMFSPDEETGHGMDKVPLDLLESKFAYTVDGGHLGELESECFNAFRSDIKFTGIASHTNNARANGMVNAISMASNFISNLPRNESPETTDGRLGFYCPLKISGGMEEAFVSLFLRDFDKVNMEKRKSVVEQLALASAVSFGGKAEVKHVQQYLNMKEELDKVPFVQDILVKAYNECGVEPVMTPIRGGTDGSRLSEMGIPTPNIFTGAHNYHSASEWVSLSQMVKATDIVITLSTLIANL